MYIASADSQLKDYAKESYGHAICYSKSQIGEIADEIVRLKEDGQALKSMSVHAEMAAKDFTRSNADCFVTNILAPHETVSFKSFKKYWRMDY